VEKYGFLSRRRAVLREIKQQIRVKGQLGEIGHP